MPQAIEKMINAAIATIGVGETNGNNTNYITQWFGLNDEWCDMAVSYWAAHSGNTAAVGRDDYTITHAQWFADRGEWHAMTNGVVASGIRRGDIIFFDWNGGSDISGIDHVGLVESVDGATVHTIEGNIDNVCKRMQRTVEVIAGFGRPAYAADPAPKPVPVPHITPQPVAATAAEAIVVRYPSSTPGWKGDFLFANGRLIHIVKPVTESALVGLGVPVRVVSADAFNALFSEYGN